MITLWYQKIKNIHVLDLNDDKIQMKHSDKVPSDFTFLYVKILLFREKVTKKLGWGVRIS